MRLYSVKMEQGDYIPEGIRVVSASLRVGGGLVVYLLADTVDDVQWVQSKRIDTLEERAERE